MIKNLTSIHDTVFALFDDCNSSDEVKRSRLYTGYQEEILCDVASKMDVFTGQIEAALAKGYHIVLLTAYELGAPMLGIPGKRSGIPLARALVFLKCEFLTSFEVLTWLGKPPIFKAA